MNIGQVKEILSRAAGDSYVYYDFCNCVPTKIDSWRGIYAEPALGWCDIGRSGDGTNITVSQLLDELKKATDGRTYHGWKGGEYSYNDKSPLHIDNPGDYSDTFITEIIDYDYCIIIYTSKEP